MANKQQRKGNRENKKPKKVHAAETVDNHGSTVIEHINGHDHGHDHHHPKP